MKEQTIKKELALLRSVLEEAEKHGACKPVVRQLLPQLKEKDKRQPRPLSREEFERLRAKLGPNRQAYLETAVFTGARKSELERLEREHVDLEGQWLHIPGTKTKGADRVIPLPPEVAAIARRHPGGPLLDAWHNVHRDLAEACDAAGITRRTVLDLRHTFASWLKQQGVDSFVVAKLMGHRDSKMVETVYAHLNDPSLRRAMNKLVGRAPSCERPESTPRDGPAP